MAGRLSCAVALVLLASCATTGRAKPRDAAELVELQGDRIAVAESINFDWGKATLDDRSKELLGAVANVLKASSTITLLSIEGHTDTTGEPDANLPLSQLRAEAVRDYIVARGVAPARLQARGFGATRPLAPNDTEAGRAQNRRVEFRVVK